MDRVCEIAKAENASKVNVVNIKNGALSGVITEALEFCFDVCAAGTPAENAKLNIKSVPSAWKCESCGAKVNKVEDMGVPICPKCESVKLKLVSGREFELESIEVE